MEQEFCCVGIIGGSCIRSTRNILMVNEWQSSNSSNKVNLIGSCVEPRKTILIITFKILYTSFENSLHLIGQKCRQNLTIGKARQIYYSPSIVLAMLRACNYECCLFRLKPPACTCYCTYRAMIARKLQSTPFSFQNMLLNSTFNQNYNHGKKCWHILPD